MSFFAFLIAFVCFLVGALAGIFTWDLHKFDPVIWGLVFLALGFLVNHFGYVRDRL